MKFTIISIVISIGLIIGMVMIVSSGGVQDNVSSSASNVSVVDGEQFIDITAKGGYLPRVTVAQAGVPTVIKVATSGTFDCSSALVIPSLSYRRNLPPSGVTEISVPPQAPGTKLQGLCSMGMYNFVVNFD